MTELLKNPAEATYTASYLDEAVEIIGRLDQRAIEKMARMLSELKVREGRLFILGVGGGAGHASHAVNDFRKIAGIESYSPTDNVSELTARVNDDGWDTAFSRWLQGSRLSKNDAILVFSVGGGDRQRNVSANLVVALDHARSIGCCILAIVGRDGGHAARTADAVVLVPVVNPDTITPHTESFQAVVWHLLVTHPIVRSNETKWESMK
jgi:D-sedoheptulose 7-phosphate isomerase